jgi:hypothetical protein
VKLLCCKGFLNFAKELFIFVLGVPGLTRKDVFCIRLEVRCLDGHGVLVLRFTSLVGISRSGSIYLFKIYIISNSAIQEKVVLVSR